MKKNIDRATTRMNARVRDITRRVLHDKYGDSPKRRRLSLYRASPPSAGESGWRPVPVTERMAGAASRVQDRVRSSNMMNGRLAEQARTWWNRMRSTVSRPQTLLMAVPVALAALAMLGRRRASASSRPVIGLEPQQLSMMRSSLTTLGPRIRSLVHRN